VGHLEAAVGVADELGLERVYVVPARVPPHKDLPAGSPSAEVRYGLTELLFAGDSRFVVTDVELLRTGPSHSLDTVLEIGKWHPGAELHLLVGADMAETLGTWHRAAELLELVTPVPFERTAVSSTLVREALPRRLGMEYLTEPVYSAIIAGGYYGARPGFDWLRTGAEALLGPQRVLHMRGTEAAAVSLAEHWGADVELAREAAILHDITKGLNREAQLQIYEEYDIIPDDFESGSEKLLHAMSGALVARARFGVCDAVFEAIACHTTGRGGMTLLDKVLYLADYIEPNRDFPEVEHMRELAYTDIDAALLYGMELTGESLRARGISPHPRTQAALDGFKMRVAD